MPDDTDDLQANEPPPAAEGAPDTEEAEKLIERARLAGDLEEGAAAEVRAAIAGAAEGLPEKLVGEGAPVSVTDPRAQDIRIVLAEMSMPERIKAAMFGNTVCRALLIRDANKLVAQFVLRNPKITLKEIEEFSRNANLSDFILRGIAESRTWMRYPTIRYNVVTNPKTPQAIALNWLRYLGQPELKKIARSKSIPQVIALNARKRLVA